MHLNHGPPGARRPPVEKHWPKHTHKLFKRSLRLFSCIWQTCQWYQTLQLVRSFMGPNGEDWSDVLKQQELVYSRQEILKLRVNTFSENNKSLAPSTAVHFSFRISDCIKTSLMGTTDGNYNQSFKHRGCSWKEGSKKKKKKTPLTKASIYLSKTLYIFRPLGLRKIPYGGKNPGWLQVVL